MAAKLLKSVANGNITGRSPGFFCLYTRFAAGKVTEMSSAPY